MVLIDPFTRKEYDHSLGLIPIETNPSSKPQIVSPYSKKSVEEGTKKPITENNFPPSKETTLIKPAWKPLILGSPIRQSKNLSPVPGIPTFYEKLCHSD